MRHFTYSSRGASSGIVSVHLKVQSNGFGNRRSPIARLLALLRAPSFGFSQKKSRASSETNLAKEDIQGLQERRLNPEQPGETKSEQTDGAKAKTWDVSQLAGDAKKKKPKVPLPYADALPLSIQPNADYFVDVPSSPFGQLAQLIEVSDGGVFAVTGVRGAGKSVLLNALCKHFHGRFHTLSLAAPIGSSHEMDFFMTLFRLLCDSVAKQLRKKVLRESFDLRAIGKREIRRESWLSLAVVIALLIPGTTLTFVQFARMTEGHYNSYLSESIDRLQRELTKEKARLSELSEPAKDETHPVDEATKTRRESDLKGTIESLGDEIKNLQDERKTPQTNVVSYFAVPLFAWIVFGTVIAICIVVIRLFFRLTRFTKNPPAVGLLTASINLMEYLDYELSVSRESEFTVPLLKDLSGKFKRSSALKQRSLSLPGLTTQYIAYMEQLLEVFPDRVIICIDELDKITDLDAVRAILREIKGALYVKNCFYVISLSEDVFQAFGGRLSSTRDIFESTFDEIFNIDRLSLDSCRQLLRQRFVENPRTPNPFGVANEEIILLCSILSSGIPRDLVRHSRECVLSVGGMPSPTVRLCWDRLFRRKLNDVKNEVLLFLGCDEIRAELLEEVDVLLFIHGAEGADLSETFLRLEETLGELDTKLKIHLNESDEKVAAEADGKVAIKGWIRNWVELEIYVLCAMLMARSLKEENAEELRYIYSLLMYSTERSRAKLKNFFLDKSGIIPGSTLRSYDGGEGSISAT